MPNKDKEFLNNYILKNTVSNYPKYTCNIVDKYVKLDYVNLTIITMTIIILIYVIFKIYTKKSYDNKSKYLLTIFSLSTSAILLYKFKSLLSMTVKYYLYAYNIKEKILFFVPILMIAISILEPYLKGNLQMIMYLYIVNILLLITSIYLISNTIINKDYYIYIILNVFDKFLTKHNINKIKTLF